MQNGEFIYLLQNATNLLYLKAMNKVIRISSDLMEAAEARASLESRSVQKQIEHWTRLGQVAEENPDLPMTFIREMSLGLNEYEKGDISKFQM